MEFLNMYKNIEVEIEIYENRKEDLEREIANIEKNIKNTQLDVYEKNIMKSNYELRRINEILESKKLLKEKIKLTYNESEEIDKIFIKLRYIDGKKLDEIAKAMNFSIQWVKKKSTEIKEKINIKQ